MRAKNKLESKTPAITIAVTLLLPILIYCVVVVCLCLTKEIKLLLLLFTYSLPPTMFLGRIVIAGFVQYLHPLTSIGVLVFTDAICTTILAWNFDLLTKIPKLGKLVLKAEQKGYRALQKYKWVKGLASTGVIIWVALPFYGTNAIIGTIVGRLIGLKPLNTWAAVIIGAVIGAIIIALPLYGIIKIVF